jgi:RNA polymerase sigma-70 factor (ECF subfamily)
VSDFASQLASHIPRLRRYARALTHDVIWADDLVQDTLERALRRRWMFRMESNLRAWLFTILYRLYLNDLANHRRSMSAVDEGWEEAQASDDPGMAFDMRRALARLSPEHRAVILLIGLEQLSYKEAAEVLQVPLGTVMSRLTRARERLRELLSGHQPERPGAAGTPHISRIK